MGPTATEPISWDPNGSSVWHARPSFVAARLPPDADHPGARLELRAAQLGGRPGMLDGAWWPRSHDLVAELPALIAEIRRQGGQISRVSYHPDTWEPAPRTVMVDGGLVKLGWFHSMDPHVLTLTGVYGAGRLDLLVVPPETRAAPAERLMEASNEPHNRRSASAVLLADVDADSSRVTSGPLANPGRLSPRSAT